MPRTALLAVAAAVGAAACGGDDAAAPSTSTSTSSEAAPTTAAGTSVAPGPTSPTTPAATSAIGSTAPATTTAPATILAIDEPQLAFTAALPDHHAVVGSGRGGEGSCSPYWWQLDGGVLVEAWPASCDPGNTGIGNGSHGHYRSPADAPAGTPTGEASSALGPATTFEQVYYECTNSCDEWPLDIAVIELSEPVDPEYPTLAVIMTDRDSTGTDLAALLEAFGAG